MVHKERVRLVFIGLLVFLIAFGGVIIGCQPPATKPAQPTTTTPVQKPVSKYNVAVYLDYTGPYAEIAADQEAAVKVAFSWWNNAKGVELGINLTPKFYDFRYDSSVASSQHPGIISDIKPIAIMEDGIPYVLAIMKQVEIDKVPVIHLTGGYLFFNKPNGWIFAPLSAYVEHILSFMDWFAKAKETPKIACKGFDNPEWRLIQAVVEKYSIDKGYKYLGTKLTENVVPDMTPSVQWAMGLNPNIVVQVESAFNTIVFAKAMHEAGAYGKFPMVYSLHQGLAEVGKVVGYETIEGYYMVTPVDFLSRTGRGQKIWYENVGKYAPGVNFEATSCRVFTNSLILLQAVEKAAAKVGADKITGQAMYDVLDAGSFDGMDLCGNVTMDPQDRLKGVSGAKVYQMVKGKITDVTGAGGWQPLPYYATKWLYKK